MVISGSFMSDVGLCRFINMIGMKLILKVASAMLGDVTFVCI